MRNTNNYALPQFDNSDLFTKEDINDAFFKIDKSLDDMQFSLNDVADGGAITIQEVVNARSYYPSLNDRLDYYKEILNQIWVNVKDYGAKGDGTTDDWDAINNAVNAIKDVGGTLFFPTGIYPISKPIHVNEDSNVPLLHNIVLRGVDSNIPYYNSYGENPDKLAMNSNIVPTSDFVGDALIIFGRCSNTLVEHIALIGAKLKTDPRTVKGILYNSNPGVSNNGIRYCTIYSCTTGIDGYNAPILKVEYTNVQYSKDVGIVVRGDSRIVECEIGSSGVQLSGAPDEGHTTGIFQPSGYYGGVGILIIDSAGNTNIIGGLIDWNCKGIVCDAGAGLIINGTRFHHNAEQHIYFRARGGGLGALGFNVNGCRFLGGGFIIGSLNGKCAIGITNDSTFTAPVYGNISGNVFRLGDWQATENSDAYIATPTDTTGPINNAIGIYTTCPVDLTITGNDMVNDALTLGSIGVTQSGTNGELTKIKFYGNNTKKLGWTSGNVRIYTKDNQARVNAKPIYNGEVDGETTDNINTSIYTWNNYIWSTAENMWRGVNQRNVKYDTTSNRPTLSSYTDKGYEYFDITIGKRIVWDGVVWRDYNGASV